MKGPFVIDQKKPFLIAGAALALSLAVGCGTRGSQGAQGPAGPVGPIVPAPQITSVYPNGLTAATNFRIRGTGFVGTAGELVLVNGSPVTILSSSPTEIWATGASYSNDVYVAEVTVQIDGRNSNSYPAYFGNPGEAVPAPVIAPYYFGGSVVDSSGTFAYIGDLSGIELGPSNSSDSSGLIWKYEFDKNQLSLVYDDQDVTYISALAWGPDGKLYMGAEDYETGISNLYRFESPLDRTRKTLLVTGRTGDITAMTWAPNGNLWLGDANGYLSVLTPSGQFFADVAQSPAGNTAVHSLFWTQDGLAAVDEGYVTWYDGALPPAPLTVVNEFYGDYDIAAATSDGVDVYALMYDESFGIQRITPSATAQPIVPAPIVFSDSSVVYSGTSSTFLYKTAGGDWYFSAGDGEFAIDKLDKGGHYEREWATPMDYNFDFGLAVDGNLLSTFDFDCSYGVGAPVMEQTADGDIKMIAQDVCGDVNPSSANGMLYVADPRGYILQIDPNEAGSTVVSADPAIGVPTAFATDGSSFFVAQANTAGTYDIIKIGSGTGGSVDRGFVTGLVNEPHNMIVTGSTLQWVDGPSAHSIALEGGAVTDLIPASLGFTNLYDIGLDPSGTPVYQDGYGSYSVSNGEVVVEPYLAVYDPRPDAFGGVSGTSTEFPYSLTQVLP